MYLGLSTHSFNKSILSICDTFHLGIRAENLGRLSKMVQKRLEEKMEANNAETAAITAEI